MCRLPVSVTSAPRWGHRPVKGLSRRPPASIPLPMPTESTDLDIGRVLFRLNNQTPFPLADPQPVYRPFLSGTSGPGEGTIAVDIDLCMGEMPRPDEKDRLFDSRQSWSLYRRDDTYWLKLQPAILAEPFWIARFDRLSHNIVLYLHRQSIKAADKGKMLVNPVCYPLDQLLLMYILAGHGGLIIHAAGIRSDGRVLVFPGPSGAGKSTISRLFQAQGYEVLSDDRVIVRKIDGRFLAFGTPWPGEAGCALNIGLPLQGICFLSHSQQNTLTRLSAAQIIERLLPVASIPWFDIEAMTRILGFCEDLIAHVPCFLFPFTPGREAVDFLVATLKPVEK